MPTTMTTKKMHIESYHAQREVAESAHQINVNEVHERTLSLNERLALWVSAHVGTIYFCYVLATLMFLWFLLMIFILPVLGIHPFDPYPFSFLFFCLGGVMQSILMPLIMVGQNLASRHTEIRAESDHQINQSNFAYLKRHQEILEEQNATLLVHTQGIEALDTKLALLLRSSEHSRSRLVKQGMRKAKQETGSLTQEVAVTLARSEKST